MSRRKLKLEDSIGDDPLQVGELLIRYSGGTAIVLEIDRIFAKDLDQPDRVRLVGRGPRFRGGVVVGEPRTMATAWVSITWVRANYYRPGRFNRG